MRVGFLIEGNTPAPGEQQAAWEFLVAERRTSSKRIRFDRLSGVDALRRTYDVLWWHCTDAPALPSAAVDPRVLAVLRRYVERGGSLLLTLSAASYVHDLGFEPVRPAVTNGAWNERGWAKDYPDLRGLAPFRPHPLFAGMPGGTYTRVAEPGQSFSASSYEDNLPSSGRVVAVEKQYIKVVPSRRIAVEYHPGKGRILCIGAHLLFDRPNPRVQPQLHQLTRNAFAALTGSRRRTAPSTTWSFESAPPSEVRRRSSTAASSADWPERASEGPRVERRLSASSFGQSFDLGGRRCLIVGHERNGIREVWCHPIRILRDVRLLIEPSGNEAVDAASLHPHVRVTPDAVMRTFSMGGATVEEMTCADAKRPAGFVSFRISAQTPVDLILTAEIDLRMMWPLDEASTGPLLYAHDEGLRGALVATPSGELAAIVGCSIAPADITIGPWASLGVAGGTWRPGKPATRSVRIGIRSRWEPGDGPIVFCFAGSASGERAAELAYRSVMRSPNAVHAEQLSSVKRTLDGQAQLSSPDARFNDAFQWALHSLSRFQTETPGLGTSYVAGFGAAERGWDGGHAVSGRPGYAWYFGRDSVWTAFAALAAGDHEAARNVLSFLGRHQDVAGKILHELTTSGFAHYDAADATPLYLILFGRYVRATGHLSFARREFARLQKAVDYCLSVDKDGDGLIENTSSGHGWVEGGSLFPVHAEHYLASCWTEALKASSYVAGLTGHSQLARRWSAMAGRAHTAVESDFWDPDQRFFRFAKLADGSFNAEPTVLPAVGLGFGIGTPAQADAVLTAYASAEFSADWGVRIVGRSSALFDPAGYHYGSVWPLFTGWVSLAEFRRDRPVQGFTHLSATMACGTMFAAGAVEEVFRGDVLAPSGVCHRQAWSESMIVQPALEGMLGLGADAVEHRLTLRPWIPPHWESFRADRLRVGADLVSFELHRLRGETRLEFVLEGRSAVDVLLALRFPLGTRVDEVQVGRKLIAVDRVLDLYAEAPEVTFRLASKATLIYRHEGGLGVIPPDVELEAGQPSRGLRIIDESRRGEIWTVVVEGPAGSVKELSVWSEREIRTADGATVSGRDGNVSRLSIRFDGQQGYVRKNLALS